MTHFFEQITKAIEEAEWASILITILIAIYIYIYIYIYILHASLFGKEREDYLIRLCMVVDWYIDRLEYTAKIKVIPKKDYPALMPCEF